LCLANWCRPRRGIGYPPADAMPQRSHPRPRRNTRGTSGVLWATAADTPPGHVVHAIRRCTGRPSTPTAPHLKGQRPCGSPTSHRSHGWRADFCNQTQAKSSRRACPSCPAPNYPGRLTVTCRGEDLSSRIGVRHTSDSVHCRIDGGGRIGLDTGRTQTSTWVSARWTDRYAPTVCTGNGGHRGSSRCCQSLYPLRRLFTQTCLAGRIGSSTPTLRLW
jgi:hypothetical protein